MPRDWKYHRNHPKDNLLSQPSERMMTKKALREYCGNCAFVSQLEPKNFVEAQNDESWILAMQEELNQFERTRFGTLFQDQTTVL